MQHCTTFTSSTSLYLILPPLPYFTSSTSLYLLYLTLLTLSTLSTTMNKNKRKFLKTSLSGAALLTLGGAASLSCTPTTAKDKEEKKSSKSKVELKLSFQEGIAPGKSLNEKFDYMEKLGIVGFEPGGRGLAGRVNEIQQALKGRNIKVSAICAGFEGFILSTDPARYGKSVLILCTKSLPRPENSVQQE